MNSEINTAPLDSQRRIKGKPGRPTVCLAMIVKDEARVIARCLESVRPIIDHWVVIDTGSTDGTQEVVRRALSDVPGELHERPWVDFAHNRTESLALAKARADYTFVIDADDVLELPPGFKLPHLNADSYTVEVRAANLRTPRTHLIRNTLDWRYEGVIHEFLSIRFGPERRRQVPEDRSQKKLPGVGIRIGEDGARRQGAAGERYRRDADVLERALAAETDPFLISRYTFYLAQCCYDCGDKEKALGFYEERARLGYWDQEVYISLLTAARLQSDLGFDEEQVIASFLRAHDRGKNRAEALHGAARFCRIKERFQQGYDFARRALPIKRPEQAHFVDAWIYDYGVLDEYAVNAYWIGHYDECIRTCERLLRDGKLPQEMRARVENNAQFARDKIRSRKVTPPQAIAAKVDESVPVARSEIGRIKLVLICGPWGSGSSAVAAVLEKLGARGFGPYFGTTDSRTPVSYEFFAFRDMILDLASEETVALKPGAAEAAVGAVRDLCRRIEQQEFGRYQVGADAPVFFKLPISALLIPQICSVFDTKLVYVMRPLDQIETSRLRRNWPEQYGAAGAEIIYRHMAEFRRLQSHPVLVVDYGELLEAPAKHARDLAGFAGLDPGLGVIEKAVAVVRPS